MQCQTTLSIDVKKRFLRFFVTFFNVFLFCRFFILYLFLSNKCRPARQSTVTVVCVSACNCKPRNYLW